MQPCSPCWCSPCWLQAGFTHRLLAAYQVRNVRIDPRIDDESRRRYLLRGYALTI